MLFLTLQEIYVIQLWWKPRLLMYYFFLNTSSSFYCTDGFFLFFFNVLQPPFTILFFLFLSYFVLVYSRFHMIVWKWCLNIPCYILCILDDRNFYYQNYMECVVCKFYFTAAFPSYENSSSSSCSTVCCVFVSPQRQAQMEMIMIAANYWLLLCKRLFLIGSQ